MNPFRAFRIHEIDAPHRRALRRADPRRPRPRRRRRAGRVLGHQLQGRARRDRRGPHPAQATRWSAASTSPASWWARATRATRPGQQVLVTGCGLSETHDGGYAEYARVSGEWVIPLPAGMNTVDAMKIGTAGFTAALAIHRWNTTARRRTNGPVVVTGATGGVGSIAINMLAGRGYEVVAVSGKPEADDYLRETRRGAHPAPAGDRPRHAADGKGAVGGRGRQRGRRPARLAHAHRGPVGQHREHRASPAAPSSRRP